MRSHLFSPVAISDSADIGSPCEPVEITQTCSRRKIVDRLDVDQDAIGDADDAQAATELHVLAHGASQGGHLALGGHGGVDDLLHPVHVAGEAGHHDAAAALRGEHSAQRHAHGGLRFGEARFLRVGRVRQEEADPLGPGQLAHAGHVRPAPVDGLEVELEVPRVQDHTLRGVEGDGHGLGHRMGDRDELDLAGTDAHPLTVGDGHESGVAAHAGLVDPVPSEADRQLGAVNGRFEIAQKVGQTAGVVLVAVGEDDPVHLVLVLVQVGELGQHQVDAGHVGIGEHDPAVDDDDAALDLDTGAITADLAEPSEEDDPDGPGCGALSQAP